MNKRRGQIKQTSYTTSNKKVSPFTVAGANLKQEQKSRQVKDNSYDIMDSDENYSGHEDQANKNKKKDHDVSSNSRSFENDFDQNQDDYKQQLQQSKEASFGADSLFKHQEKLKQPPRSRHKKRGSKQPQILIEAEQQHQLIETPKHNQWQSNAFASDTKQMSTVKKRGSRRQSQRKNPFESFAAANQVSLKDNIMNLIDDPPPLSQQKPRGREKTQQLQHTLQVQQKAVNYESRAAALTSVKKQKNKISEYLEGDASVERTSHLRVSNPGPYSVASVSLKSKAQQNAPSQFSNRSRVPTYQDSRYQNKLRMSRSRDRQLSSRRSMMKNYSKQTLPVQQLPSLDPSSVKPMGPKMNKQPNLLERLSLGNLVPTASKRRIVQPPASGVNQQVPSQGRRKLQQQKQQPTQPQKISLQNLLLMNQQSQPTSFPDKEETDAKISDEESIVKDQMEKIKINQTEPPIISTELNKNQTEPKQGILSNLITQDTQKSSQLKKQFTGQESSLMEGIGQVIDTFVEKIVPSKEPVPQPIKQGQKVVNLDFQQLSASNDPNTEEKSSLKTDTYIDSKGDRSKSKKGRKKKRQRKSHQLNSMFNFMRDSYISANTSIDLSRKSAAKPILVELAYKEILVLIGMIQDPSDTYFHYQLTTIRDRYPQFENSDKIAYFDQLVQAIDEDNYEPTLSLLPQIALILKHLVKIQKLEQTHDTPGDLIISDASQKIIANLKPLGDKSNLRNTSVNQDLGGIGTARPYSSTGNLTNEPSMPKKVNLVNPAILRPKPSLASSSIALTNLTPNTKPNEDDEFMTAFGTSKEDLPSETIDIGSTFNQRNSLTEKLNSARRRLDQELEEKAEEEKKAAEKIRFMNFCEKTKEKLKEMFLQVVAQDPFYERKSDNSDEYGTQSTDDHLFRVYPDKLFEKFIESKKKADNDLQDFIEYEYLMAREKLQTLARQNQAKIAQQPELQRRKSKDVKAEKQEESKDVTALEALMQSVRSDQDNDEEYEYATETADDPTVEDNIEENQENTDPLILTSNSGCTTPQDKQIESARSDVKKEVQNPFDQLIQEKQEQLSDKQSTQTKVKNPFRDYFTPDVSDEDKEEVLDLPIQSKTTQDNQQALPEYFSQNTFGGSELKLHDDKPVRSKKVEIKKKNLSAAEEILATRTKPSNQEFNDQTQQSDEGGPLNQLLGSLQSSELQDEFERSDKRHQPIQLNKILDSAPLEDFIQEENLQQETEVRDFEQVKITEPEVKSLFQEKVTKEEEEIVDNQPGLEELFNQQPEVKEQQDNQQAEVIGNLIEIEPKVQEPIIDQWNDFKRQLLDSDKEEEAGAGLNEKLEESVTDVQPQLKETKPDPEPEIKRPTGEVEQQAQNSEVGIQEQSQGSIVDIEPQVEQQNADPESEFKGSILDIEPQVEIPAFEKQQEVEEAISFAMDSLDQPAERLESFNDLYQPKAEVAPIVSKKLDRTKSAKPPLRSKKSIFQSASSVSDLQDDAQRQYKRSGNPLMLLLGADSTKNIIDDCDKHSDEALQADNGQWQRISNHQFENKSTKEQRHKSKLIKPKSTAQKQKRSGSVMNIPPLNSTGKMSNFSKVLGSDFMSRMTAKEQQDHRDSFIGAPAMGYYENGVYQDQTQIMEQAIERASQRHYDLISKHSQDVNKHKSGENMKNKLDIHEKMSVKTDNRRGNIFNKKRRVPTVSPADTNRPLKFQQLVGE